MYVKLIEKDTEEEVSPSTAYQLFIDNKLSFVQCDKSVGKQLIQYIDGSMVPELSLVSVDILYNGNVLSIPSSRMTTGKDLLTKLELDSSEYYFIAENLLDPTLHRCLFPEINLASAGIIMSHPLKVDQRCDYTLTPVRQTTSSPYRLSSSFITGFNNLGNTCYLASAMQSLVHIEPLVKIFLNNSDLTEQYNTLPKFKNDVLLAKKFADFVKRIYSPDAPPVVSFHAIKDIMGQFNSCYKEYNQEDSHEFVIRLIDHLSNAFNRVYNKACFRVSVPAEESSKVLAQEGEKFWNLQHNRDCSAISDLFTSVVVNTQSCSTCGFVKRVFEPMSSFALQICHRPAKRPPRIFDSEGNVIGLVGESLSYDDYVSKACELYPDSVPLIFTSFNYESKSCIYELTPENYDRKHDVIISYKNEEERNICISYDQSYFILSVPDQQSELSVSDLKKCINYHDSIALTIDGRAYDDHDLFDLDLSVHNFTPVIRVNYFTDNGMYSSLQVFSSTTEVESYCENCKDFTKGTHCVKLWRLSPVLIFHLNRFKNYKKDDSFVKYPIEDLNLSSYFHKDSPYMQTAKKYNLTAVSLHSGSLNFGHYTAFARDFLSDRWLYCNDSRVVDAGENSLVSSNAYILVYSEKK